MMYSRAMLHCQPAAVMLIVPRQAWYRSHSSRLVPQSTRIFLRQTLKTAESSIRELGIYEEFRPWYKAEHDILHMTSYCYFCTIDSELGEPRHEDYEVANGMKALWINIHQAIAHNREVIANSPKKGLSIERETWLLERVASQLP